MSILLDFFYKILVLIPKNQEDVHGAFSMTKSRVWFIHLMSVVIEHVLKALFWACCILTVDLMLIGKDMFAREVKS